MDVSVTASWEQVLRQKYLLITLFVLLIAIGLRFYNLGGNSLWLDEAIYANVPHKDLGSFLEYTRNKNSTPILLPYVYFLLGDAIRDPLYIRLPPAFFSICSVAVLLFLPRAGVSRSVSVLAAFMLAISPAQIFYAQEVREYSFSVLMSCLLIFTFSGLVYKRTKTYLIWFAAALFIAPLAAYGTIFLALAVAVAFVVICIRDRQLNLSILLIPWLALLAGIVVTYHATASYQMYVTDSWYLVNFLPPDGIWAKVKWTVVSTLGWFSIVVENQRSLSTIFVVLLGGLLFSLNSANVLTRIIGKNCEPLGNLSLFIVLLILLGGSIVASFIGVYPFGGIRQHLYAVPLIALCTSQSLVTLSALGTRKHAALLLLIGLSAYSAASVALIPRQYREIQDIVSAISNIDASVSDESIYVYYMGVQAVDFHYPDRRFFRGTPARHRIDLIGNEIIKQVRNCHVHLVFTHVWKSEDEDIIAYLKKAGMSLIEEHKYAGARVLDFSACSLE